MSDQEDDETQRKARDGDDEGETVVGVVGNVKPMSHSRASQWRVLREAMAEVVALSSCI